MGDVSTLGGTDAGINPGPTGIPGHRAGAGARTIGQTELQALKEEYETYLDANAQDFIANLRLDVRQHWDRIIILTGRRGVGKSTLGLILAKLCDYSFGFKRIAYEPEHIMPIFLQMAKDGPYKSMVMDEGGEIWNRSDWATKVSKTITKQVIGDRWLYSVRFILAPTIFHLDRKAIDMADYWIKVYSPDNRRRGFGEVRLMGEQDYYNKALPYAPPIFDIRFDDLPPDIADAYEKFKSSMGKQRSEKYGEIIDKETGNFIPETLDLEDVAKAVYEKLPEYQKDNGLIDWRLIYNDYQKKGLGQERAKTIASHLNKSLYP